MCIRDSPPVARAREHAGAVRRHLLVHGREATQCLFALYLPRHERPFPVLAIVGVRAVDADLAVDRADAAAEAAVDGLFGHPQCRDRLAAPMSPLEQLLHQLAQDALAPVGRALAYKRDTRGGYRPTWNRFQVGR